MSNNRDPNTPVSAQDERRAPVPSEAAGLDRIPEVAPAEPAADLGTLLKKAEDEAAELRDAWLRAKAETENTRRLAQNDITKAHKYAVERFAQELLGVKDALELTLATPNATIEALRDGVELTLKNLNAAFAKTGITEIDPAGEKYDPHR